MGRKRERESECSDAQNRAGSEVKSATDGRTGGIGRVRWCVQYWRMLPDAAWSASPPPPPPVLRSYALNRFDSSSSRRILHWLHYRHHCEFTLSFSLWLLDVVVLFGPTHHWWQPWWFSLHRQAASPSSSPSAPSASAPLVAALCTPHTNVLVNELLLLKTKTKTKKRCISSLFALFLSLPSSGSTQPKSERGKLEPHRQACRTLQVKVVSQLVSVDKTAEEEEDGVVFNVM